MMLQPHAADSVQMLAVPPPGPVLDGAAFEAFYDAHARFVWRNLKRLGVPSSELEDVCQEVFVTVHRSWHSFEERGSPRSWLYGVLKRVAARHRRGWDRRERRHAAYVARPRFDTGETAVAGRVLALKLQQFLAQLDLPKRDVFVLAELEQLSAREIAERIGVPANTVYSRLRAARAAFEARFGPLPRQRDEVRRVHRDDAPTEAQQQRVWLVLAGLPWPSGASAGSEAAASSWLSSTVVLLTSALIVTGVAASVYAPQTHDPDVDAPAAATRNGPGGDSAPMVAVAAPAEDVATRMGDLRGMPSAPEAAARSVVPEPGLGREPEPTKPGTTAPTPPPEAAMTEPSPAATHEPRARRRHQGDARRESDARRPEELRATETAPSDERAEEAASVAAPEPADAAAEAPTTAELDVRPKVETSDTGLAKGSTKQPSPRGPETAPRASGDTGAAKVVRPAPPPPPRAGLLSAEEIELLETARTALEDGSYRRALTKARAHHRRFPSSPLSVERDAIAATAHCGLGRAGSAEPYLKRLDHAGRSKLAKKIRSRCR